jgi:hypothetical protein
MIALARYAGRTTAPRRSPPRRPGRSRSSPSSISAGCRRASVAQTRPRPRTSHESQHYAPCGRTDSNDLDERSEGFSAWVVLGRPPSCHFGRVGMWRGGSRFSLSVKGCAMPALRGSRARTCSRRAGMRRTTLNNSGLAAKLLTAYVWWRGGPAAAALQIWTMDGVGASLASGVP